MVCAQCLRARPPFVADSKARLTPRVSCAPRAWDDAAGLLAPRTAPCAAVASTAQHMPSGGAPPRRNVLLLSLLTIGAAQLWRPHKADQQAAEPSRSLGEQQITTAQPSVQSLRQADVQGATAQGLAAEPDYAGPGPWRVSQLPRLEHTCDALFPACTGGRCLLRLDVFYPRGTGSAGVGPPYPLAILTGGFTVNAAAYHSYAQRLASWGYTVVAYDKVESALEPLDDRVSAGMIREIVDWAGRDPVVSRVADASRIYLAGHSRGGKLSVLAAAGLPGVRAVCLLDPVDNTPWAPLSPTFPSAIAALQDACAVPLAVVGGGVAGDCVPASANYRRFYDACGAPAWEVVVRNGGHFQFLDEASGLQRAICTEGAAAPAAVRAASQAVMVAWAELMLRGAGSCRPSRADALNLANASSTRGALDALNTSGSDAERGSSMCNGFQERVRRLISTEAAVGRILAQGTGAKQKLPLYESRIKNLWQDPDM